MASPAALRRLQHDMKELEANPIPNIVARPISDSNLLCWTVNMVATEGMWAGQLVHLHLEFPPDYPMQPPQASLTSPLDHPNVFGSYICIDMLHNHGKYSRPYEGWSSAYTLSTILTQLCGFLLEDTKIEQMTGGHQNRRAASQQLVPSGTQATEFSCPCGFRQLPGGAQLQGQAAAAPGKQQLDAAAVVPAPAAAAAQIPGSAASSASIATVAPASSGSSVPGSCSPREAVAEPAHPPVLHGLDQVDDHLVRGILRHLGPVDLHRCTAVEGRLARLARDVLQRSELMCFHSKRDYTEALLGLGVSRVWHSDQVTLRGLSTRPDYLSWQAFKEGARRSAWNAPIDAFLPLYLNPEHGKQALERLPFHVQAIITSSCRTGCVENVVHDNPRQLLMVMAHLLNSLVVEMVGGSVGRPETAISIYAVPTLQLTQRMSDAALQTFCHLHHLLLAVALQPGSKVVEVAR